LPQEKNGQIQIRLRLKKRNHPPTDKKEKTRYAFCRADIRGRFGTPGNQNAFRHGLAGIAQRRADGVLNPQEQSIREEILSGLLTDKSGAAQINAPCGCWRR